MQPICDAFPETGRQLVRLLGHMFHLRDILGTAGP